MKRIAKFHKVSFEQFAKDWKDTFEQYSEEEIRNIYDSLKLPKRATTGSAGYDFYAPVDVTMKPGEIVKIPTGIRVEMEEGWVLKCYPRSGLGFKFRLQLNNTVGIIDSDYFFSDNEGHIFAKLTNDTSLAERCVCLLVCTCFSTTALKAFAAASYSSSSSMFASIGSPSAVREKL